jgi:hypothetical protein
MKEAKKNGTNIEITDTTVTLLDIESLKQEKQNLKAIIAAYQDRIDEINGYLALK